MVALGHMTRKFSLKYPLGRCNQRPGDYDLDLARVSQEADLCGRCIRDRIDYCISRGEHAHAQVLSSFAKYVERAFLGATGLAIDIIDSTEAGSPRACEDFPESDLVEGAGRLTFLIGTLNDPELKDLFKIYEEAVLDDNIQAIAMSKGRIAQCLTEMPGRFLLNSGPGRAFAFKYRFDLQTAFAGLICPTSGYLDRLKKAGNRSRDGLPLYSPVEPLQSGPGPVRPDMTAAAPVTPDREEARSNESSPASSADSSNQSSNEENKVPALEEGTASMRIREESGFVGGSDETAPTIDTAEVKAITQLRVVNRPGKVFPPQLLSSVRDPSADELTDGNGGDDVESSEEENDGEEEEEEEDDDEEESDGETGNVPEGKVDSTDKDNGDGIVVPAVKVDSMNIALDRKVMEERYYLLHSLDHGQPDSDWYPNGTGFYTHRDFHKLASRLYLTPMFGGAVVGSSLKAVLKQYKYLELLTIGLGERLDFEQHLADYPSERGGEYFPDGYFSRRPTRTEMTYDRMILGVFALKIEKAILHQRLTAPDFSPALVLSHEEQVEGSFSDSYDSPSVGTDDEKDKDEEESEPEWNYYKRTPPNSRAASPSEIFYPSSISPDSDSPDSDEELIGPTWKKKAKRKPETKVGSLADADDLQAEIDEAEKELLELSADMSSEEFYGEFWNDGGMTPAQVIHMMSDVDRYCTLLVREMDEEKGWPDVLADIRKTIRQAPHESKLFLGDPAVFPDRHVSNAAIPCTIGLHTWADSVQYETDYLRSNAAPLYEYLERNAAWPALFKQIHSSSTGTYASPNKRARRPSTGGK
jgi:hypothetical protein